jgi:hypothetical protein
LQKSVSLTFWVYSYVEVPVFPSSVGGCVEKMLSAISFNFSAALLENMPTRPEIPANPNGLVASMLPVGRIDFLAGQSRKPNSEMTLQGEAGDT